MKNGENGEISFENQLLTKHLLNQSSSTMPDVHGKNNHHVCIQRISFNSLLLRQYARLKYTLTMELRIGKKEALCILNCGSTSNSAM